MYQSPAGLGAYADDDLDEPWLAVPAGSGFAPAVASVPAVFLTVAASYAAYVAAGNGPSALEVT